MALCRPDGGLWGLATLVLLSSTLVYHPDPLHTAAAAVILVPAAAVFLAYSRRLRGCMRRQSELHAGAMLGGAALAAIFTLAGGGCCPDGAAALYFVYTGIASLTPAALASGRW